MEIHFHEITKSISLNKICNQHKNNTIPKLLILLLFK